jgi:hypothetical protein
LALLEAARVSAVEVCAACATVFGTQQIVAVIARANATETRPDFVIGAVWIPHPLEQTH